MSNKKQRIPENDVISVPYWLTSDDFRQKATIDITDQLEYDCKHGRSDKAPKVLEALATNTPFMLYQDPKCWCIIIPKLRVIVTLFGNGSTTAEALTPVQFQNRVKQCYVIYPKFESPTKKLLGYALLIVAKRSKFEPCKAHYIIPIAYPTVL